MKMRRAEFLSWIVWGTVALVGAGTLLVVVWLFDEALGWDLFHGAVEQLLYGVLGSALALGACGAAIGFLLSLLELAHGVGRIQTTLAGEVPEVSGRPVSSKRRFLALAGGSVLILVGLLATLAWFNQRVQAHRGQVFEQIASDQMELLTPRARGPLAALTRPREVPAPAALAETLRNLRRSSFCQEITLLLADPEDDSLLWRYRPTIHRAGQPPRFESFFIVRAGDRAAKQALRGDTSGIDRLNGGPGFVYYHLLRGEGGEPLAVIRLDGDPRESFRDYEQYGGRSASL